MMRKPIIAANWKLNKNLSEATAFATAFRSRVTDVSDVEMVICPVALHVAAVAEALKGSKVGTGAQNMYFEDSGAFTGEISAPQISEAGAQYVILGHSERRQYFGEDNAIINKKVHAAHKAGLIPIVCVGETLEQREAGQAETVVEDHIRGSLAGLSNDQMKKTVVAYEPVWAIGTGKTATPEDAQAMHAHIRRMLSEMFDGNTAAEVRIQYGGSVKPDNVDELMGQKDIDGALVGGAALKVDSFERLVKFEKK